MTDTGGQLPFEGSAEIASIVEGLIREWKITTFVETGTQYGATALWAAKRVNRVFTMECDAERCKEAHDNLKDSNVILWFGKSEELLREMVLRNRDRVLFFLDAHSMDGTPIVQELHAIRFLVNKFGILPIICIHDIEVPNNPTLGFDNYEDGTALNLDRVKPTLFDLGITAQNIRFNSIPDGAARGFCYITPKQ